MSDDIFVIEETARYRDDQGETYTDTFVRADYGYFADSDEADLVADRLNRAVENAHKMYASVAGAHAAEFDDWKDITLASDFHPAVLHPGIS